MNRNINIMKTKDFQLVLIAIELVHKVLSAMDCNTGILLNPHMAQAVHLAQKWNELFIKNYIPQGEENSHE